MNLTRIRYFVETARLENVSRAAQALYVTQPNLSRQLGLMEQELGFELFRRAGKGIRLTPAGAYLYEQLKDIPDRVDEAVAQAEVISRQEAGSLSIGVLEGQDVSQYLSRHLDELRRRWPAVTVELERNSFRYLRQGLERGRYDMIFTLAFETVGRSDWETLPVFREPGAIFISCTNPLAARDSLTMENLRDEPFVAIAREESPGGYDLLIRQCAACGFTPNIVRESATLESLLLCVEMGMGAAMLDRNTRLENSSSIRIYTIPDSEAAGLTAAWTKDCRNPMVRRLADSLRGGQLE